MSADVPQGHQRRNTAGGRDKGNHDTGHNSHDKVGQENEGRPGGASGKRGANQVPPETTDEERMFKCNECGEAAELGAIDEEDGQWYCKACWESFLGDDAPDTGANAKPAADGSSSTRRPSSLEQARALFDEDSNGVAIVLSDRRGSGFCLSQEGIELLKGRGKDYQPAEGSGMRKDFRADPDLVALVQEDSSRISGEGTTLVVQRIPSKAFHANAYTIVPEGGKESIAINLDAHRAQADELRQLRTHMGTLLAAMRHALYEGGLSSEERTRCLRDVAPADVLCGDPAQLENALATIATNADSVFPGLGEGGS